MSTLTKLARQFSIRLITACFIILSVSPSMADGCNIDHVMNGPAYLKILQSHELEKKPFETSKEREKRTAAIVKIFAEPFTIRVQAKVSSDDYNADRGMLYLDLQKQFLIFRGVNDGRQDYAGVVLKHNVLSQKQYAAQNGLGVKTSVVEFSYQNFGVGFPHQYIDQPTGIMMEPAVARSSMLHLTIAIVVDPVQPFILSGKFHQFPSFGTQSETPTMIPFCWFNRNAASS